MDKKETIIPDNGQQLIIEIENFKRNKSLNIASNYKHLKENSQGFLSWLFEFFTNPGMEMILPILFMILLGLCSCILYFAGLSFLNSIFASIAILISLTIMPDTIRSIFILKKAHRLYEQELAELERKREEAEQKSKETLKNSNPVLVMISTDIDMISEIAYPGFNEDITKLQELEKLYLAYLSGEQDGDFDLNILINTLTEIGIKINNVRKSQPSPEHNCSFEISQTSNITDYKEKRLQFKPKDKLH